MQTVTQLADALMRAVVASGAVTESKVEVACAIMREELKAFVFGPTYADERELAVTGRHHIAFAALVAACVNRIAKES